MAKRIFLILMWNLVHSVPQINTQQQSAVEVEKQHIVEIFPDAKHLFEDSRNKEIKEKQQEENTKEILKKIALLNENQGLYKKKLKPYLPLQHKSYLRSQDNANIKERSDLKFLKNPYVDPILTYIDRKFNDKETNERLSEIENMNNKNGNEDQIPPGFYIKRKVTHQETMVLPNPYILNYMVPVQPNIPHFFYEMNGIPNLKKTDDGKKTKDELEIQTIDNIKNIISIAQIPPMLPFKPNLNVPPLFPPHLYQHLQNSDSIDKVYGPYTYQQLYRPGKQQWQWPLGQYFPVVIKDPFVHMMNAFTSMVEYGPQAAPANSCNKELENKNLSNELRENRNHNTQILSKSKIISNRDMLAYNIPDDDEGTQIVTENKNNSDSTTTNGVKDLQITDTKSELYMKPIFRKSKKNEGNENLKDLNTFKAKTELLKNPLRQKIDINTDLNARQSPPIRDPILFEDELSTESEEKVDGIHVSNQGTKKLFSKDNSGSGIFVYKLKVRKGGVAIAGPGGIATAGSGGTAIVGPNGFAYTHPDSLAIAGSGTKVIAVEPTVNLSQAILDHDKNKSWGEGHTISRIGKLVAVGPIIYYNKG